MAILRKREELLPVTCAVLADDDRASLFGALRKRSGNKLDRIAAFCGVPVSLVSDWASGRSNVPYHFLQRLCENFKVPMPPVGELRRELQPATDLPSRPVPPPSKHYAPPPPPPAPRPEPAPAPAQEAPAAPAPRPERQDSGRKPRRGRERKEPRARRQEPPRQNRAQQAGSKDPKFSELAAYWTGVVLTAGKVEADAIILAAGGAIGHNYLGAWSNICRDLFGIKAALSMGEDGTAREACLPAQDLGKFLDRAGVKPGGLPPGGAPRWVWSNAQWRTAFVRGVVDASARFERTPALFIERVPEELRRAVKKMLNALGVDAKDAPEGGLTLEGAEPVERYFTAVGADNLRLRDQLKAHFRNAQPGSPEAAAGPAADAAAPGTATAAAPGAPAPRTGGRRRGRGRRGRGRRGAPQAANAPQGTVEPGNGNPQASEPMDDPETAVDIGNEALPVRELSDEQPPAPPTPFMEE